MQLDSVDQGDAMIIPAFDSTVRSYTVVTETDAISLVLAASAIYQCTGDIDGQVINFPSCSFNQTFAVTPVARTLTVTLSVPTDSPLQSASYVFSLLKAGCYVDAHSFQVSVNGVSNCVEQIGWPLSLNCLSGVPSQTTVGISFNV